eukprot:713015-Alexandrium_andersonii.AAC.1
MSASLVGSEMCIRDRLPRLCGGHATSAAPAFCEAAWRHVPAVGPCLTGPRGMGPAGRAFLAPPGVGGSRGRGGRRSRRCSPARHYCA